MYPVMLPTSISFSENIGRILCTYLQQRTSDVPLHFCSIAVHVNEKRDRKLETIDRIAKSGSGNLFLNRIEVERLAIFHFTSELLCNFFSLSDYMNSFRGRFS